MSHLDYAIAWVACGGTILALAKEIAGTIGQPIVAAFGAGQLLRPYLSRRCTRAVLTDPARVPRMD